MFNGDHHDEDDEESDSSNAFEDIGGEAAGDEVEEEDEEEEEDEDALENRLKALKKAVRESKRDLQDNSTMEFWVSNLYEIQENSLFMFANVSVSHQCHRLDGSCSPGPSVEGDPSASRGSRPPDHLRRPS